MHTKSINSNPHGDRGEASHLEISQSLPVPEYKMGWIVGKRGSYINQLSKKSGAQITISDSTSKEYGTIWKYVQITGSGRAVDRAKKLLHIRLERLEPRDVPTDPLKPLGDNILDGGEEEEDDLSPGIKNSNTLTETDDFNAKKNY